MHPVDDAADRPASTDHGLRAAAFRKTQRERLQPRFASCGVKEVDRRPFAREATTDGLVDQHRRPPIDCQISFGLLFTGHPDDAVMLPLPRAGRRQEDQFVRCSVAVQIVDLTGRLFSVGSQHGKMRTSVLARKPFHRHDERLARHLRATRVEHVQLESVHIFSGGYGSSNRRHHTHRDEGDVVTCVESQQFGVSRCLIHIHVAEFIRYLYSSSRKPQSSADRCYGRVAQRARNCLARSSTTTSCPGLAARLTFSAGSVW